MANQEQHELISEGLQKITDAAKFMGISRSLLYSLIKQHKLPTVRIGRSHRIPIRAVKDLVLAHLVDVER